MASKMRITGLIGPLFMLLFALIWTMTAATMVPFPFMMIFIMFGLLFICLALYQIVSVMKRSDEAVKVGPEVPEVHDGPEKEYSGFCPYCGSPVEPDYGYCRVCGRRI